MIGVDFIDSSVNFTTKDLYSFRLSNALLFFTLLIFDYNITIGYYFVSDKINPIVNMIFEVCNMIIYLLHDVIKLFFHFLNYCLFKTLDILLYLTKFGCSIFKLIFNQVNLVFHLYEDIFRFGNFCKVRQQLKFIRLNFIF